MTTPRFVPHTKHAEFILALSNVGFPADHVLEAGINVVDYATWLTLAQDHLVIAQRKGLEKNPAFRQILPYDLVSQRGADGVKRYATYRRGTDVGEARLANNSSVGWGGHIDARDVIFSADSVIQLDHTIEHSSKREKYEELKITLPGGKRVELESKPTHLFLVDNSNEVGRVHLGVVSEMELPGDAVVEANEPELVYEGMFTAQELLADLSANLESWSALLLRHLVVQEALAA